MYSFGILSFCAIFALTAAQNASKSTGPTHGKVVMCSVYTEFTLASRNDPFKYNQSNLNLCTHLVARDSQLYQEDPWTSRNDVLNNDYLRLTNQRSSYPHLKVLVSTHHTLSGYLKIASTPQLLVNFLKQSKAFIWMYNFDGLDLQIDDWEQSSIAPEDIEKICKFVAKLKEKLNVLLTLTVKISKDFSVNAKYDLLQLSESFGFIHIIQEYNSIAAKPFSKQNDALKSRNIANIQQNIENITLSGVPKNKTTLGLLLNGVRFNTQKKLFEDYEGYIKTCHRYSGNSASNWEKSYDASGLAVLKNKKTGVSIVYESSRTLANLVRFAMKHELAGVTASFINMDDYLGTCKIDTDTFDDYKPADGVTLHIPAKNETDFPLLRAINEAIEVTLDEMSQSGAATQFVLSACCMIFVAVCATMSSSIYV